MPKNHIQCNVYTHVILAIRFMIHQITMQIIVLAKLYIPPSYRSMQWPNGYIHNHAYHLATEACNGLTDNHANRYVYMYM